MRHHKDLIFMQAETMDGRTDHLILRTLCSLLPALGAFFSPFRSPRLWLTSSLFLLDPCQAALSFAFPWAAYFTSEALELSGIVTILFCGMIMAGYTRHNFAEEARDLTQKGYKCVAVVAETYVFVYLGMCH